MPSQADSGKAFEYALAIAAREIIESKCPIVIEEDTAFKNGASCFQQFPDTDREKLSRAATASMHHILSLEPILTTAQSEGDILQIKFMPDSAGKKGDVRDILFSRPFQQWQIGVSAKNNHKAVKHSRLSDRNNFAKSWVGCDCSQTYFDTVIPIFQELRDLKKQKKEWKALENKHGRYYVPILDAFKHEINLLTNTQQNVPEKLVTYLLGVYDFYKVMRIKDAVQVLGFNMNKSLNQSARAIKPAIKFGKPPMPTKIISFGMKDNSTDTLILTCDHGWQISFRIHNAETRVVPSLKFDVNIVGLPQSIYSSHFGY